MFGLGLLLNINSRYSKQNYGIGAFCPTYIKIRTSGIIFLISWGSMILGYFENNRVHPLFTMLPELLANQLMLFPGL